MEEPPEHTQCLPGLQPADFTEVLVARPAAGLAGMPEAQLGARKETAAPWQPAGERPEFSEEVQVAPLKAMEPDIARIKAGAPATECRRGVLAWMLVCVPVLVSFGV